MPLPKSRAEALAAGFKPAPDIEALVLKLTRKSAKVTSRVHDLLLAARVDCNDAAFDGQPCRALPDGKGNVIIYFCTAGACSPASALIGPAA